MPRRPTMTLDELRNDGRAIRLADLMAITGLSRETLCDDIRRGYLVTSRRYVASGSPHLIVRGEARRYLASIGLWTYASLEHIKPSEASELSRAAGRAFPCTSRTRHTALR